MTIRNYITTVCRDAYGIAADEYIDQAINNCRQQIGDDIDDIIDAPLTRGAFDVVGQPLGLCQTRMGLVAYHAMVGNYAICIDDSYYPVIDIVPSHTTERLHTLQEFLSEVLACHGVPEDDEWAYLDDIRESCRRQIGDDIDDLWDRRLETDRDADGTLLVSDGKIRYRVEISEGYPITVRLRDPDKKKYDWTKYGF